MKKTVEVRLFAQQVEFILNFDKLHQRLRQPRGDLTIAILHAGSRRELSNLISLRELLSGLRIILILPDKGGETVSMGYKLFPRFMTYQTRDFMAVAIQVVTIMTKMLENVYHEEVKC